MYTLYNDKGYVIAAMVVGKDSGATSNLVYVHTDDVERELAEFRKACGADSATYRRFIVGFKTVLNVDRGVDVPRDIYNRFINYN